MADEIPFSKQNQRKLTPFVGQELLYDYLSHQLDPERMAAIEQLVKESREIQDEIHTLNRALNYLEELSETNVSEEILEQIKTPGTYMQGLFHKIRWSEWPTGIKLGIEVFAITFIVISCIVIIPWNRVVRFPFASTSEIVLSEVTRDFSKKSSVETEINPKETAPAELTYQDESLAPQAQTTSPAKGEKPAEIIKVEKPVENLTSTRSQGFLFRGSIEVANLPVTSQKFVEKINELGGRKAGEVDLGWKKGDGTYFHFTIPEARYEELVAYLNEYGKLKILKEKHDRIMPDGITRVIITVSEDTKKQK